MDDKRLGELFSKMNSLHITPVEAIELAGYGINVSLVAKNQIGVPLFAMHACADVAERTFWENVCITYLLVPQKISGDNPSVDLKAMMTDCEQNFFVMCRNEDGFFLAGHGVPALAIAAGIEKVDEETEEGDEDEED